MAPIGKSHQSLLHIYTHCSDHLLFMFVFLVLKPPMFLFSFLWSHEGDQLCTFTMRGSAFLWHQIRCMVAVLFMIGQGVESVDVSYLETFMFVPVSKLNPILTWGVYIFIKCWFRDELVFTQVIDTLLDTKKTPRKPQYLLASEIPLVLRTCEFENVEFICSPGNQVWSRYHEVVSDSVDMIITKPLFHA